MARESRVKKSFLNARMNLICYLASLVVAFFTRKVFLDQLGTEFIGLTGTLQSLLCFLNLAELGVGSAIGYVLYRPIFDDDKAKINEIISVFGYLYRCIGWVILGAGVLLSVFLPWIFPNTSFSWGVIYLGFYAFLGSSLLGYFVNYRQTLLSADQRNYEVTGYYQAVTSSKMLIQMLLAIYVQSFALFLFLEILFGIIYSCVLSCRINKIYPWLESDIKLGKQLFKKYPEIGRYVKQLFVHKIGGFVQFQITPFLVYSYVSLPVVALYGNYTLITQKLQGFVVGILDSTAAGVGNLISEGDAEKIYATYKELFAVRFLFAGVLSACLYYLCNPLIAVWLGTEYPLSSSILLLISIQFFLGVFRGLTDQFLFGFGLFNDVWSPVVESTIFIVVAIIGGTLYGLLGVLCAPLVSTLTIIYIWKPYFLFHKGFRIPVYRYYQLFFTHMVGILVAYWGAESLSMQIYEKGRLCDGWGGWITCAFLFTTMMLAFSVVLLYIFSSGLRIFVRRFVNKRRKSAHS